MQDVSLCDDGALPVTSDAVNLVSKSMAVAEILYKAFLSFGMVLSFVNGKTDIVLMFCGGGSKRARKDLMCLGSKSNFSHGKNVHIVHFVDFYKHLGSISLFLTMFVWRSSTGAGILSQAWEPTERFWRIHKLN